MLKTIFFKHICHTVSKIERYYSYVLNIMAYRTSHVRDFLVFGFPNAKYLAFSTPDVNALMFL